MDYVLMSSQGQAKRPPASQVAGKEKPAKRTRVSRACDQCRVAREKCDGLQPICSTCPTAGRQCSYTANPKKRGIQPGYIRTLELALAWLFQHNPENEIALNEHLAQGETPSLLLSRDSRESNKLYRRWRKAKFYNDVDKHLSGGESSRQEHPEPSSPHSDEEVSDAEELAAPIASHDAETKNLPHIEAASHQTPQKQQAAPSALPTTSTTIRLIPPNSYGLIEAHFIYTHSWLPLSEKHDILKLTYSYPAEGLPLTSTHVESGSHAELWSILAVASLHLSSDDALAVQPTGLMDTIQLYNTARSLIPEELGSFDAGHVKALLNLAVFNMKIRRNEAAWLLVGYASRLLAVVDHAMPLGYSRRKHVYSGCFLLDSMLALQLNRRPYLQKVDLDSIGPVEEDGLEEWQPWSGENIIQSHDQNRLPMLSLSTFKYLIDPTDILVTTKHPSSTYEREAQDRLHRWEACLPSKLHYVRSPTASKVWTPQSILLQVAYCSACFACNTSDAKLCRLLVVLEEAVEQIAILHWPPTIRCLMDFIYEMSDRLVLEHSTRTRLQNMHRSLFDVRLSPTKQPTHAQDDRAVPWRQSFAALQMPTPDSLQAVFSSAQPMVLLPQGEIDRNATAATGAFLTGLEQPTDTYYPEMTSDLDSFFDELATLDRATKSDNQPQFMQNLGFGPDANMSDLFSEYIPTQSSAFLPRDDSGPVDFGQYGFYSESSADG